nr:hypothetical protein Iba_chr03cCG2250 [Ipomoea batatas]
MKGSSELIHVRIDLNETYEYHDFEELGASNSTHNQECCIEVVNSKKTEDEKLSGRLNFTLYRSHRSTVNQSPRCRLTVETQPPFTIHTPRQTQITPRRTPATAKTPSTSLEKSSQSYTPYTEMSSNDSDDPVEETHVENIVTSAAMNRPAHSSGRNPPSDELYNSFSHIFYYASLSFVWENIDEKALIHINGRKQGTVLFELD